MRVLWFCNVPLPVVWERMGARPPAGGGWMGALADALSGAHEVDLGIVSIGEGAEPAQFVHGGVWFWHASLSPGGSDRRIPRVMNRWMPSVAIRRSLAIGQEAIRRFSPDVVHVHGTEGPLGLLQESNQQPFLLGLQGLMSAYAKEYADAVSPSDLVRDVLSPQFVRGVGLTHGRRQSWRAARREVQILSRARFVTGRTEWDRGIAKLLNPSVRYFHCDRALRAPFYETAWRGNQSDPVRVFNSTGAKPYKGLGDLLTACRVLGLTGRRRVELRVAGARCSNVRWTDSDVASAEEAGLRVVWLGSLSAADVAKELSLCEMYVHPSHIENSPNAVAEAQCVGCPVVATSVGGTPSLVEHGVSGLLVAKGDAVGMAAAMARLANEPEFARSLGKTASAVALHRHSRDGVADATLATYRDLAGLASVGSTA